MRYVIVSIVDGEAGEFNNNLRKELYEDYGVKSSKLPAHFTIKSPFECDDISELENTLDIFSKNNKSASYRICGYDHFDNRVIFMKILMSKEGQLVHDKLIDALSKFNYINFDIHDGKDKTFHVTISSKKIQKIYNDLWNYINKIPCEFKCEFNNISVYKWIDNTWKLHNRYNLTKS